MVVECKKQCFGLPWIYQHAIVFAPGTYTIKLGLQSACDHFHTRATGVGNDVISKGLYSGVRSVQPCKVKSVDVEKER